METAISKCGRVKTNPQVSMESKNLEMLRELDCNT